eukprot:GGOE01020997.1.p3 GENE.GGOE01020997.1~~GGOE01020997.1.p3  ORF type:complete len:107 (-),score=13.07 GGOE01020997.1:182-502(-)
MEDEQLPPLQQLQQLPAHLRAAGGAADGELRKHLIGRPQHLQPPPPGRQLFSRPMWNSQRNDPHLSVVVQCPWHIAGEEEQHCRGAQEPVLEHSVCRALEEEDLHR